MLAAWLEQALSFTFVFLKFSRKKNLKRFEVSKKREVTSLHGETYKKVKISKMVEVDNPGFFLCLWSSRPDPGRRETNLLEYLFTQFFVVLIRFYEGLIGFHTFVKPFETPQKMLVNFMLRWLTWLIWNWFLWTNVFIIW